MCKRGSRIESLYLMAAAIGVFMLFSLTAQAELLFYDSFAYVNGTQVDTLPGWAGGAEAATVENGDGGGDGGLDTLVYPGLPNLSKGGRVQVNTAPVDGAQDQFGADFSRAVTGEGNAVYASFLYKPVGSNALVDNQHTFFFRAAEAGGGGSTDFGRLHFTSTNAPLHTMAAAIRTDGSAVEAPPLPATQTSFIVVKYTMVTGADNDTMELWINPTPNQPPPAPSAIASGTGEDAVAATGFVHFRFRIHPDGTGVYEMDEIRVGTTWEDVAHDVAGDVTPPTIIGEGPTSGSEVIGPVTHVALGFDEIVTNADPSKVLVNGSPATASRGSGDQMIFSGFAQPVGTANVTVTSGVATDFSGNPVAAGVNWSFDVATTVALLLEHFDYPPGSTLANTAWGGAADDPTQHEVLNLDGLGDPPGDSLRFTGLDNLSAGGRLWTKGTADDGFGLDFPGNVVGEGNSAYVSFLLKPLVASEQNEYLFHFDTAPDDTPPPGSPQNQLGRLEVLAAAVTPGEEQLAVRLRNDVSRTSPSISLTLNTTYLIVVKLTMVPGIDNDTMSLWINPTPGLPEPPAQAVSLPDPGSDLNPATGIQGFNLRPRADDSGSQIVDELRAGTTWASVTEIPPPDVTAPSIVEIYPEINSSVYGRLTHVEMLFDESVRGVTAGALSVDGSAATAVSGFGIGPYVFSGFTPVTAGAVNVTLANAGITDLFSNPLVAVPGWTITVATPPSPLLFHEPFDYVDQAALVGSGSWEGISRDLYFPNDPGQSIDEARILNSAGGDSLQYNELRGIAGGRLQMSPRVVTGNAFAYQFFDLPLVGESTSVYMSLLYQPRGEPGDDFISFFSAPGGGNGRLARFQSSASTSPTHTLAARWFEVTSIVEELAPGHSLGTPVFVVAKATMVPGAENDTLTVWINPPLGTDEAAASGAAPPVTATSQVGQDNDARLARGFSEFGLRVNSITGEFDLDELRVGTTWEAVTPIDDTPRVTAGATPTSILLPARETTLQGGVVDVFPGGALVTTWTLISSPNANASTATIASPNALNTTVTLNGDIGAYVFELAARDLTDKVGTATVSIALFDSSNLPPVVDAGPDRQAGEPFGAPVVITLAGSVTDPESAPVTAVWSVMSKPAGTADPAFDDANVAQATVTLDNVSGDYVFRLTGSDSVFVVIDDVTITVIPVSPTDTRRHWMLYN